MTFPELKTAIDKVLKTNSEGEMKPIFAAHPELSKVEVLQTIFEMARDAESRNEPELARLLGIALDRIVTSCSSRTNSESERPDSPIVPSVPWAISSRYFLVNKEHRLDEALVEAERLGEGDLVEFLQLLSNYLDPRIGRASEELFLRLQKSERFEEAWTVKLLYLDTQIAYLILNEKVAPDERQKAKEHGTHACLDAVQTSILLNDAACHGYYSAFLADEFYRSGQFERAGFHRTEALRSYRELINDEPPKYEKKVAGALVSLGLIQGRMNQHARAERSYSDALAVYRKLEAEYGKGYEKDLADVLLNLGATVHDLGRPRDAERHYLEASDLYRALVVNDPKNLRELGLLLNNLATVQRDLGNYDDCDKSHAESLKIRRELRSDGSDHSKKDLAQSLTNIGVVAADRKEWDAAENHYFEALTIYDDLSSLDPSLYLEDRAMVLTNLSAAQSEKRKFADAEHSLNIALSIRRTFGQNNRQAYRLDLSATLNNMGFVQVEQGEFDKAVEYFEQARSLIEEERDLAVTIAGRNLINENSLSVYDGLMICYYRLGDNRRLLEVAELSKGRSMLDFLNFRSGNLLPTSPSTDLEEVVGRLGKRYLQIVSELQKTENDEKYVERKLTRTTNARKLFSRDDSNSLQTEFLKSNFDLMQRSQADKDAASAKNGIRVGNISNSG